MMEGDMERWRRYFRKAGVDIWSVIHEAIHVAAVDYPKDFRRRRVQIAETLFARELVQSHCAHVEADTMCIFEEGTVGRGVRQMVEMQAQPNSVADQGNDDLGRHRRMCHDEAEAHTDELEKEHLVVEEINIIKEACFDANQPEYVVFEALYKLKYLKITVKVLEVTEIGKKVKGLRKHPSIRVSTLSKELLSHWKCMAHEWIEAGEKATAATIATTAGTGRFSECRELSKQEGLPLPPLDEDAVLEPRASSVEVSQLFSFIDEDMCGGRFNERETPASSVEQWGLKMAEERGSATRDRIEFHTNLRGQKEANGWENQDDDNRLMVLNNARKCSGPGRPEIDMRRVVVTSSIGKSSGNLSSISSSSLLAKNAADHSRNSSIAAMKLSDKNLVYQKLEIAKRKLNKGYAEAENAKKQRTVQVLDVSNLPKSGKVVRIRVNSQHWI